MANVTIRNLDHDVMARVRERAERYHRSAEADLCQIFTKAVRALDIEAFKAAAANIRVRTADRQQTNITLLIREDRDR
jgi:plasmid stability protein